MLRSMRKRSRKAGLPPGTLAPLEELPAQDVIVTVIDYDKDNIQEKTLDKVEEAFPFKDKPSVTWINVDGIGRLDIIEKLGGRYGVHPLVLEDIVHTGQRPKMEEFDDYIYVVLNMLLLDRDKSEVAAEQVSIILGSNFVVSFQERPGDVFDSLRDRIRTGKGRIRNMGADYLAYSLLDAIVDNYFAVLEDFGEKIEGLEDELISDPSPRTLQTIHDLKREMIYLRKSVWPLREVISSLQRCESPLIQENTRVYLRDVYDHTIQVIETVETFRDMISGMLDIYLSSVSNRMNEVMKVLTIIATIFIPLTFIAGVYGMNFQHMPELGWWWAYPAVWAVMAAVSILMIAYFRRKKWL
jgi:magnesium transporter